MFCWNRKRVVIRSIMCFHYYLKRPSLLVSQISFSLPPFRYYLFGVSMDHMQKYVYTMQRVWHWCCRWTPRNRVLTYGYFIFGASHLHIIVAHLLLSKVIITQIQKDVLLFLILNNSLFCKFYFPNSHNVKI